MKVIFLDVDGVLNQDPDGTQYILNRENIKVLEWLVQRSKAFIVLTSAWRHVWDLEQFKAELKRNGFRYADRVIDATGDGEIRGEEIKNYLDMDDERRRIGAKTISKYVILDDNDDMGDMADSLVLVDANVGLTMNNAAEAVAKLAMG